MKPSPKLEALALRALQLKIKLDKLTLDAKAAQQEFVKQCIAEDMFNPDTKAIGPVRTNFTPNRYFDLDTAIDVVSKTHPEYVEESKVTIVDPKLLQEHMTPIEKEAAMKFYEVPYKVGLKVND